MLILKVSKMNQSKIDLKYILLELIKDFNKTFPPSNKIDGIFFEDILVFCLFEYCL